MRQHDQQNRIRNNSSGRNLGALYVLEGQDGVGKSALSSRLARYLNKCGNPTELLSFPGNESGTLGELVYRVHHAPQSFGLSQLGATCLQLLHIAAHVDTLENQIIPLLRSGSNVVLDRFWWSTVVYGRLLGADDDVVSQSLAAEMVYWQQCQPTAIFLVQRASPLKTEIPYDAWLELSIAYAELARVRSNDAPVIFLDNNGSEEEGFARILASLQGDGALKHPKLQTREIPNKIEGSRSKLPESGLALDRDTKLGGPDIFTRLSPAVPSDVYDTLWRFAAERQAIFFRRLHGMEPPWTDDPILSSYKFTNAYRASDRVSQFLIRNVIYSDEATLDDTFFRILLFKIFNKIETWRLLQYHLGTIRYEAFKFKDYDRILTKALGDGKRIYSAAYIMASGKEAFGETRKHRNHLRMLQTMMEDSLPSRIADAKSMSKVYDLLCTYPTIGSFLGFQYAIDINYSTLTNFSEMDFVVAGPGAKDGIRKCFRDTGGLNEVEIIRLVADRQGEEFAKRGLAFQSLWGRILQLIDCQNLFCEVSKYARVAHPEVKGTSERNRIKQRFVPHSEPIDYWYPPKWGINQAIVKSMESGDGR